MKKLFFVLTIFLSVFFSQAKADVHFDKFYMQHSVSFGDSFIVMLDDNSIWELFTLKPRSQTWSEWWNNIPINIDQEFLWKADDWMFEDTMIIGENNLDRAVFGKLNEDDQKKLRLYDYVIENMSANKVAFARPVSFAEFTNLFIEYSKDQYSSGYSYGYSDGYSSGHSAGYQEGNDIGYEEGYVDGSNK